MSSPQGEGCTPACKSIPCACVDNCRCDPSSCECTVCKKPCTCTDGCQCGKGCTTGDICKCDNSCSCK